MKNYSTEQEDFWAGSFGNEYINRNQGSKLLASNLNFFSKALGLAGKVEDCIEFGANIGMNLKALKLLYPDLQLSAVEINATAAKDLKAIVGEDQVITASVIDFTPKRRWDLVLVKGLLIHINPDKLDQVYENMYQACGKYILIAEYYNPVPVAIDYRGHSNKLFKRDFAGELMKRYSDIELLDYGFCYRNDPTFPQDDITWFLLHKK